jgi:hypothetical protein
MFKNEKNRENKKILLFKSFAIVKVNLNILQLHYKIKKDVAAFSGGGTPGNGNHKVLDIPKQLFSTTNAPSISV